MSEFRFEDWIPISPLVGPPLPSWMQVTWPWYEEVPPPSPPGTASLSGKILDELGNPLRDVLVTANGTTTESDYQGNYLIPAIEPGAYTLVFEKTGYLSFITSVSLLKGDNVLDVVMQKEEPPPEEPPPTKVHIMVRNSDGYRLSGVKITIDDHVGYTNEDGTYITWDIVPGTYTLQFEKEGYKTRSFTRTVREGNNIWLNYILYPVIVPEAPEYFPPEPINPEAFSDFAVIYIYGGSPRYVRILANVANPPVQVQAYYCGPNPPTAIERSIQEVIIEPCWAHNYRYTGYYFDSASFKNRADPYLSRNKIYYFWLVDGYGNISKAAKVRT